MKTVRRFVVVMLATALVVAIWTLSPVWESLVFALLFRGTNSMPVSIWSQMLQTVKTTSWLLPAMGVASALLLYFYKSRWLWVVAIMAFGRPVWATVALAMRSTGIVPALKQVWKMIVASATWQWGIVSLLLVCVSLMVANIARTISKSSN